MGNMVTIGVGLTTIVAIINKIVQSVLNFTANSKVHTSKIDVKMLKNLEKTSKKYLLFVSALILFSNLSPTFNIPSKLPDVPPKNSPACLPAASLSDPE